MGVCRGRRGEGEGKLYSVCKRNGKNVNKIKFKETSKQINNYGMLRDGTSYKGRVLQE